ncbi:DUF1214 domain-containing protein [Ktedonobacter robiniae]|uniref:DUF1214 domain-containing protein n=1 Tax=Ktedonobacter robiniae TaxID=2778365 RepID=A0ABQ3UXY7_9CHLR|nr:DUF1214 domain-containing protein [Ktedonobacter robiniae]GHO57532.1 hypothetical protein KSB_60070 [Ktedonobacter robiniae]
MQEQGMARRGGAAFIWKWGAICGAVLGAIQIIISLLSPGSLKTIIDVLVWLVAFFVIGLFAARQTGRVTTGALVGLVAGLIGGLIAVIFAIVQIATNGQVTQALNRAGQRGGSLSPGVLHAIVVVLIALSLIVTIALELGLGVGLGALGGLVGRRLARPATSTPVVDPGWTPPSPPLPRSPARYRAWASLLNLAFAVLGILTGAVLAILTAGLLINAQANAMQTTTNGWNISLQCGKASNGILLQAACAQTLPMVNLPQEAVYWTATVDGAGQTLTGGHDYRLYFPPGGTPPNQAFWSLTMTNTQGQMVANPSNRYSVGDRSGLVPNTDGSIDIYIQQAAPAGHEANWLPAPGGYFKLWLRVYQPGAAILSGAYHVPPIVEVH